MTDVDPRLLAAFYRDLYKIRRTEEEIVRIYPTDKIKSPVHLSIGQEAVAVGVCQALGLEDIVFGTYRGHALYLAKGGSLKAMMAELYGKVTGCARGKGGSMHLVDVAKGVMGTSAIVGTTIPLSVGYAYNLKYHKSAAIVASFFGDGAVDEGAFHESLNFAALKKLPVLFVCENNLYAIHSYHLSRHHSDNICERAAAYGMETARIEDGDIFNIYEAVKEYTAKIRAGQGPVLLECFTSRWKEHVGSGEDFHLGYRSREEVREWQEKDELKKIRGLLDPALLEEIEVTADKEIEGAFAFAENSPFPAADELYQHVFRE